MALLEPMPKTHAGESGRARFLRYAFLVSLILVGLFLAYTILLKPKNQTSTSTDTSAGSTGTQQNQPVYTPTSMSFTNITASSNTATTTDSNNKTVTNTTNTATNTDSPGAAAGAGSTTPVQAQMQAPPVNTNPVGTPPVQPHYSSYTITSGDTLWKIAARAGTSVSAIYALNKSTIDSWAASRHYPISPNAVDNIFPGETILIPAS
jgi:LysM repeat protein